MKKKPDIAKKSDKGHDQGLTLVKMYLPTMIRDRLKAYAAVYGMNMNEAAAKILHKYLVQWMVGGEEEPLPLPPWDKIWDEERKNWISRHGG